MKFMKLYIPFFILATAMLVACNEYEDTVVPGPTVSADNAAVRFLSTNATVIEIDPSVGLSFSLTVVRDNGTAAIDVPITVVTNTKNSFSVPSTLTFPAGTDTVSLTIAMVASAPTGEVLPLEIKFDDAYTNPYKTEYPVYNGKISIVKWNSLGTAQFYDSFSFYSVAEVTLEQRDDMPEIYRISYPYSEAILLDAEWEGWIGGGTQDKITFTVDGENVTWDDFWYTNLIYQGTAGAEIKAYLPSVLDKEGDEQSVVVTDDAESIQYFELYPSFYVDGLGGWGLNVVYLGFPGFDLAGALELPVFGQ